MEIVSRPGPEDKLKKKCPDCFCVIAYVPSEVQIQTSADYGGGYSTNSWIKCPNCKHDILLRSS